MKRVVKWVAIAAGVLLVVAAATWAHFQFFRDWDGRPFCHKQYFSAFGIWATDQGDGRYPNVAGDSRRSLLGLTNEMGSDPELWADQYNYVPGLKEGDPGHMVLMYVNRPTRWTWHGGLPPRLSEPYGWIIVPVDFKLLGNRKPMTGPGKIGSGELSEWITEDEFRRRLTTTLDYLRTNERPHWQAVLTEHMAFLNRLENLSVPIR